MASERWRPKWWCPNWTILATAFASMLGCHSVDRGAERAFVRGNWKTALAELRERQEQSAYDFVLESSLLASAALRAGNRRLALEALSLAAWASEVEAGAVPERVERARNRRSRAFYRLIPEETAMNAIYRSLLLAELGRFSEAESALAAARKAQAEAGDNLQSPYPSPGVLLIAAIVGEKLGLDEEVADALDQFRESQGYDAMASRPRISEANLIVWIDRGLIPEPPQRSGPNAESQTIGPVRLRFDRGEWHSPLQVVSHHALPIPFRPESTGASRPDVPTENATDSSSGLIGVLGGSLTLLTGLQRGNSDRFWHLLPADAYIWIGRVGEPPDLVNPDPTISTLELEFLNQHGRVEETQRWTLPVANGSLRVIYARDGMTDSSR